MKRSFRDADGQFITAQEWFEQNNEVHICCPSVSSSFTKCTEQLERMRQFQTTAISKVELALVGAAGIKVYQGDTPAITVYKNGQVQMWGAEFSCAGMVYRPDLLQRFKDVMAQRIKEQQVIVDKANATFIEVADW